MTLSHHLYHVPMPDEPRPDKSGHLLAYIRSAPPELGELDLGGPNRNKSASVSTGSPGRKSGSRKPRLISQRGGRSRSTNSALHLNNPARRTSDLGRGSLFRDSGLGRKGTRAANSRC